MLKQKKPEIKSLYYITHIENIPSILSQGIFSHQLIQDRGIEFKPIYDKAIVGNRRDKKTPDNNSLWNYANVYFQPRNPMLYRVVHERDPNEIVVLGINPDVLHSKNSFFTDGNAANHETNFHPTEEGIKAISEIWRTLNSEWWNSMDGSKRKIMAECLVRDTIPPDYIHSIYVSSHEAAKQVNSRIKSRNISVIPEPNMFFIPANRYAITSNLFLAEGDMFFSNMHTLTVSVNTVGIMGKGLASRAKYQFPDVYVMYQDACRNKSLKMGKPYLYKREASFDDELIDEPGTTTTPEPGTMVSQKNGAKWFLLFATKRHWRENSDFNGIEEGLEWLVENYKKESIKSIALPALGCGLGNLRWEDVGPVMCKHLQKLDIQVAIYLPRERAMSKDVLTPKYLLG